MNPVFSLIAGPVGTAINKVIDHLFPDKNEAAKAKLKMMELQQAGEFKALDADLQIALAQIGVNKEEAASGNAYTAGWRPTIGYICGLALAWNFLGHPIMTWYLALAEKNVTAPPIFADNLMELVVGMLGLAGFRTFEKYRGVSR